MNNDLAFHLCKRLVEMPEYQSKNIFLSPFSVSLSELGIGHSLLEEIDQRKGVDIDVSSALYVSNKLKPFPEFLEKMKEFNHSDGLTVDFRKTHGKIDQAIDDLESNALMFLLTYIYFKGKHTHTHTYTITHQSTFHVDAETIVPLQMMHPTHPSKCIMMPISLLKSCLDYNDSFSMVLAVPHIDIFIEDKTIKDFEMAISRQHIEKWRTAARKSIYYLNILKGLGIADMFTDKANLAGISEEMIFISKPVLRAAFTCGLLAAQYHCIVYVCHLLTIKYIFKISNHNVKVHNIMKMVTL
uniref:Thyroxine-binding globulin n=1 Tax=Sinocyclocheilus grahami TaxID=75366 RepID=A0A672QRP7_SINGR